MRGSYTRESQFRGDVSAPSVHDSRNTHPPWGEHMTPFAEAQSIKPLFFDLASRVFPFLYFTIRSGALVTPAPELM